MRLTWLKTKERILEEASANIFDSSWLTKAGEYFQRALAEIIGTGEYSDDEIFGLIADGTAAISTTPVAFYGVGTDMPLKIISLEHATFRMQMITYQDYQIRKIRSGMQSLDLVVHYAIHGKYIYFLYKSVGGGLGTPAAATVKYIKDLPTLTDAEYITDHLTHPIVFRVISKAAVTIQDILRRSI